MKMFTQCFAVFKLSLSVLFFRDPQLFPIIYYIFEVSLEFSSSFFWIFFKISFKQSFISFLDPIKGPVKLGSS